MRLRFAGLKLAGVAACAMLAAAPSWAATIAENNVGAQLADEGVYYLGQSFTATGTGTYNNASISFFTGGGGTPLRYADGNLYLYSTAFGGMVSQLGTGPGFLGSAAGAGGAFNFGASLFVTAGTTYYAYMDTRSPLARYSSSNPYAGGVAFQADGTTGLTFSSFPSVDLRFGVVGDPAAVTGSVPEPATWALMLLGFGALGSALRGGVRGRTKVSFA